jgi:IclR family KDG regulon transcriptional repressor
MRQAGIKSFQNTSLERALRILSAFSFDSQHQTLTELSNSLKLPRSTTYRLISTLVESGFLGYDDASKRYSLGFKLFELGSVVYNSMSLRNTASPFLAKLLATVGNKAVFLGIFRDDEVIYVDKKEDPHNPIKFATTELGRHRPPYFGMFGQVFLAHFPAHDVDRILSEHPLTPFTKNSITDIKEFKARLDQVRKQGYAYDEGGAFEGISGVAAPVFVGSGRIIAAMGVGFIASSENARTVRSLIKTVCETAEEVTKELARMALPGDKVEKDF